jgi:hypothetical protein
MIDPIYLASQAAQANPAILGITGTPQLFEPRVDPLQLAQQAYQSIGQADMQDWFLRSRSYERPIIDHATGNRTILSEEDKIGYRRSLIKKLGTETAAASGKEALAAEFMAFPGFIMGAADLWRRKWDVAFKVGRMIGGDEEVEFAPLAGHTLRDKYNKYYEAFKESEAELAVAIDDYAESGTNLPVAAAAVSNLVPNAAVMLADPVSKVAKITAAGVGIGVRGFIWGGSALLGSRAWRAVTKRSLQSPGDEAAASLAKRVTNKLTDMGRGAPSAFDDLTEAFDSVRAIEYSQADARGVLPGTYDNIPSIQERGRDLAAEIRLLDKARFQGAAHQRELRRAGVLPGRGPAETARYLKGAEPKKPAWQWPLKAKPANYLGRHPDGQWAKLAQEYITYEAAVAKSVDQAKAVTPKTSRPTIKGLTQEQMDRLFEASKRDDINNAQLGVSQASLVPSILEAEAQAILRENSFIPDTAGAVFQPKRGFGQVARADKQSVQALEVRQVGDEIGYVPIKELRVGRTNKRTGETAVFANRVDPVTGKRLPKPNYKPPRFDLFGDLQRMQDEAFQSKHAALQLAQEQGDGVLEKALRKDLIKAADEAERVANNISTNNLPRRGFPTWGRGSHIISEPAKHARRVAANFMHNQQMSLIDSAARRQRFYYDVPEKELRDELFGLVERSGNWKRGDTDTYEAAVARVKAHPNGAAALNWLEAWQKHWDEMYQAFDELGSIIGDSKIEYQNFWLHHMWAEPIAESRAKIARNKRFQLPATGAFEKKRTIPTYFEGVHELGLTPRVDDFGKLVAHVDQMHARTMATKKLISDMMDFTNDPATDVFVRLPKGEAAPKGYVQFKSAFTDRLMPDQARGTNLFVEKEIGARLRNVLEQPMESGNLQKLSASVKRANFAFSLFHAYTLWESSVAIMPSLTREVAEDGTGMLYNALGRQPRVTAALGMNNLKRRGWKDGEVLSQLVSPETFKEAVTMASYYGTKLDAPSDVGKHIFDQTLEKFVAKNPKFKALLKGLEAQQWMDARLWERYHTPLKVVSFDTLFHQMKGLRDGTIKGILPGGLSKKFGARRSLKNMDDDEIGFAVASYVNDEFGGQAWELAVNNSLEQMVSNPSVQKLLNGTFLSLDWNVSAFKAGMAWTQMIPGTPISNPVRGMLGMRHWRNASFGMLFYANMANKALSGHYMHENEPSKRLFSIDSGARDDTGRPYYIEIGKQFKEIPNLIERGVPGFLASKAMPHLRWAMASQGVNFDRDRYVSQMLREGKELGLSDKHLFDLRSALEALSPITAGNQGRLSKEGFPLLPADRDTAVLRAAGYMLPISKGMTKSQIIARMASAIRAGEQDEIDNLVNGLIGTRYAPDIREMMEAAKKDAMQYPTQGAPEPRAKANQLRKKWF